MPRVDQRHKGSRQERGRDSQPSVGGLRSIELEAQAGLPVLLEFTRECQIGKNQNLTPLEAE